MKFSSLVPALLFTAAGTLGADAASVEFTPVREADVFAAGSAAETIIAMTPATVSHEVIVDDAKAQPGDAKPADPDSFLKGWKGSIEGGLNGSNGNSDNLSFRLGMGASRETSAMKTTAALTYSYATSDGEKTRSRGVFDLRNDWNLGERTIFFATGKLEYDEFEDWDWRLSAFTGPGYYFVKSDRTKLLGRIGAGVTKEVGGSTNELVPEGLVGVDLEHKITERQKCFVTVEYIPSISEAWNYRALAKAGWEVLVDPEVNMTLKIGIEDRYDHNPGPGFQKNDVEYFILLAWNF